MKMDRSVQSAIEKVGGTLAELALEEAERRELYAKNPNCDKCKKKIEDIEDAFIVRRASGETVLIHWVDLCFSREVQDMLDRYLADKKPRVVWTEKAAS
jgi:hypothetical protein